MHARLSAQAAAYCCLMPAWAMISRNIGTSLATLAYSLGGWTLTCLFGAACAWFATRALRTLIFAFAPADYALLAAAAGLLALIAFLAAWLPARRASRLNPLDALR